MPQKRKRVRRSIWNPDEKIYTAVGKAITAWAEFEEEAFRLYCELMGQPEPVCGIAFFSLGTFSGKLDLISKTIGMQQEGNPELLYWSGLKAQTKLILIERNFIAHSPVGFSLTDGGRVHSGQITGLYEVELRKKTQQIKNPPEIEAVADAIMVLFYDWEDFRWHLSGTEPFPERFHSRDPNHPVEGGGSLVRPQRRPI